MEYKQTPAGAIYTEMWLGQTRLTVGAENVRKERTGVHAKVTIGLDSRKLAFDVFNVERNEERRRLAKAAFQFFDGSLREVMPLEKLEAWVSTFCEGVWEETLNNIEREDMSGAKGYRPSMISPYLIERGGTFVYGRPGGGKSWITMLMAQSVNQGVNEMWPVQKRRVLFVNIERSRESFAHRLAYVNENLGLPYDTRIPVINARGKSLDDIYDSVHRITRTDGIEVLFLDSVSRAGRGSLLKDEVANGICDALSSLCPTWWAIAHMAKSAESDSMFGSMHFEAAADIMMRLDSESSPDGNSLGVSMRVTKGNDLRKMSMSDDWTLTFDDEGLAGIRRGAESFAELESRKPRTLFEKIVEHLADVERATGSQLAADLNGDQGQISRILRSRPDVFTVSSKQPGKGVYYELI